MLGEMPRRTEAKFSYRFFLPLFPYLTHDADYGMGRISYLCITNSHLASKTPFDSPPRMLELIYSPRFYDLMRFMTVVGTAFLVLFRTGNHMERVSRLRLSNTNIDSDD